MENYSLGKDYVSMDLCTRYWLHSGHYLL
uniref:Uncharacterized protein n=1 Tax=Rhizophora mucronata TaxID=61149 RepID=A0A2P2R458_RHIMU